MVKGLAEGGRYWEARGFGLTMYHTRLQVAMFKTKREEGESCFGLRTMDQRDELMHLVAWEGPVGTEEGREMRGWVEDDLFIQV